MEIILHHLQTLMYSVNRVHPEDMMVTLSVPTYQKPKCILAKSYELVHSAMWTLKRSLRLWTWIQSKELTISRSLFANTSFRKLTEGLLKPELTCKSILYSF